MSALRKFRQFQGKLYGLGADLGTVAAENLAAGGARAGAGGEAEPDEADGFFRAAAAWAGDACYGNCQAGTGKF